MGFLTSNELESKNFLEEKLEEIGVKARVLSQGGLSYMIIFSSQDDCNLFKITYESPITLAYIRLIVEENS